MLELRKQDEGKATIGEWMGRGIAIAFHHKAIPPQKYSTEKRTDVVGAKADSICALYYFAIIYSK